MKWIGFLCIILAGFYGGQLFSHRLVKRVHLLTLLKLMIHTVETQIRFTSAELYDIFSQIAAQREFSQLSFPRLCVGCLEREVDFPTAWQYSIEEDGNMLLLEGEEVELLRNFGGALGTTDTEGQIGICRMYGGMMEVRLKEAAEKRQKLSKLYSGLGTLLGLGIAVLTL